MHSQNPHEKEFINTFHNFQGTKWSFTVKVILTTTSLQVPDQQKGFNLIPLQVKNGYTAFKQYNV